MLEINSCWAQVLRVAAASSMTDFLTELKVAFEQESHVELEIISNSSGTLANQIQNGAPFDIFLSANTLYTKSLFQKGYGLKSPTVFALSQLVFWSKNRSTGIREYLLSNECKTIAIAQPETAPFGQLAEQYIKDSLLLKNGIQDKMVFGKNVSMVNQYIYSESVDAAFTSKSSYLKLKELKPDFWTFIPTDKMNFIPQSALIITQNGEQFLDFLINNHVSQDVLKKYGYLLK